jgi:hypothetical protein
VNSSNFPPLFPSVDQPQNPDASSTSQNAPRDTFIGGESVVQLAELVTLRERDITRRINLKNGIRDIEYQWQHVSKGQDDFMMACSAMMTAFANRTMDSSQEQSLHDAWRQLQHLSGHVKSRELGLGTALNQLFQLENKLYVKEEKFYEKLQIIAGAVFSDSDDDDDFLDDTDDFTAVSAPSTTSSATTRSIAHKYYGRVGDIHLLRERIFNFESEHRRQKAIREAQRNAGHRVQPPDKIFYKKFLDEKKDMVEEYVQAKAKMEELKESCARQGVEVQPPDLPPFLDHIFRVDRSVPETGNDDEEEEVRPERSLRYLRNLENDSRVAHWVTGILMSKPTETTAKDNWETLSETTGPHVMTDQQVEDYLAYPIYTHLRPSPSEKTIPIMKDKAEKDVPIPERFPEEKPKRRYSVPDLSTFSLHVSLREGALDWMEDDHMGASSKSGVIHLDDTLPGDYQQSLKY